ncbi:GspE/PulE family protein [Roseiconus lacunae]|uniref:GspE/PulE family protein n=1 Tax=Roseiconus lacunae TaxID=2605694 RepID=A0ABT7PJ97_9BACT|nr:GspE/PulE family protein [Roseiconus lacunae]MDM4016573.1 GspE/PulE family protein [Roseiconus lacunae]WRQ49442.1 GspE/PulE family protein [Stieleria sp. HD01]
MFLNHSPTRRNDAGVIADQISPTSGDTPQRSPESRIVHPRQGWTPVKQIRPLGQRLIEAGLLREDQLETALAHQQSEEERLRAIAAQDAGGNLSQLQRKRFKRLGEVVAELGLVDEADLLPVMGEQLGVEGVKLREGLIDPAAVQLIPREDAERYRVLPLMRIHDELTVAMADPQDLSAIDALTDLSGCRIRPVLTLASGIERLLPRCYEADFSVDSVTADLDVEQLELESEAIDLDLHGAQQLAEGSPVINLVNYAIIQAVRQGASDIHVEAGQKFTSIRFRIDGALREVMKPRKEMHAAIVSRIKVMARLDIAEHRHPQDGRLHVRISRRDVDLRVSTLPTVLGEKVVMRVLDRGRVTFDLNRLGIPQDSLACLRRMLGRPHGLVLVTGPTGSGKTTTLYSAMELIKGIERNVITVEDPVEYQLELINQVQVANDSGITFAKALRSILRQDPDVIMVGEIRDRETAETAIQAALTGHLVLSTLHTNDSATAITRLVDMGVEHFKIAASLVGVVAQRLMRNLCPSCRESYYASTALLEQLHYEGDLRHGFARSRGCADCFESGYRGRTGVYELFEITPAIRTLINDGADLESLRSIRTGPTLISEGLRLAEQHLTSLEEVGRVALVD